MAVLTPAVSASAALDATRNFCTDVISVIFIGAALAEICVRCYGLFSRCRFRPTATQTATRSQTAYSGRQAVALRHF